MCFDRFTDAVVSACWLRLLHILHGFTCCLCTYFICFSVTQRFSKLGCFTTHPIKPQLQILGRASPSPLYDRSFVKRLGRKAGLAGQNTMQKEGKALCPSPLRPTGKWLLTAHVRSGTCSAGRLWYQPALSLLSLSWNLPSHSFLIHLAEEQESMWLCLWFLYHCLLCLILCNPSASFNFTSYSLCLNSAFLILNIYGSLWEEYIKMADGGRCKRFLDWRLGTPVNLKSAFKESSPCLIITQAGKNSTNSLHCDFQKQWLPTIFMLQHLSFWNHLQVLRRPVNKSIYSCIAY